MDNIDLIPKKPKPEPFWQETLFYLSFLILIVSFLFSIGFSVLAKRAASDLEKVNQELAQGKTQAQIDAEEYVLKYEKKISAFGAILKQRKPLSVVLDFLAKNVHPQVFFTKMNFSAKDDSVEISGLADNFQILGQQISIFEKAPLLKSIDLNQVGINKSGGVDFSLEIIFESRIFEQALLPSEPSE